MRPLATDAITGMGTATPAFVLGLSVIRSTPVPVVDLGAAIGAGRTDDFGRLVSIKLGARRVALAVGAVIGLRELDDRRLDEMPPLLHAASADIIDMIGVLDAQLLLVLRATRLLPEDLWQKLSTGGTPS